MKIGVLGGGQLGRMLALAGYPLGQQFRFLDVDADVPAGDVGELVVGGWNDSAVVRAFGAVVDVVTYEFENVPCEAVQLLAAQKPVYPPPGALAAAQDRLSEKSLFSRLNIPTARFAAVTQEDDLRRAVGEIGLPAVLKTRRMGYDGKGQVVIRHEEDVPAAWQHIGGVASIVEAFVPFDRELSIIGVRGRDGATAFYPLVENVHRDGILRQSRAPAAEVSAHVQSAAEAYCTTIMESLQYVGVLTIELFEKGDGLLANEMAPRVHNSGHWTIDGAETSQFENHLRAITGLPLGSTAALGQSLMFNLIGSLPSLEAILAIPGAHPHFYGKAPRPGRKVGHVTLYGTDESRLNSGASQLSRLISRSQ